MQARVCVQNFNDGDIQGFLYIDDGTGESLVTTTARFEAGSAQSKSFTISGTKTTVTADCDVDVDARSVEFTLTFSGSPSPSIFTRPLAVSSANC